MVDFRHRPRIFSIADLRRDCLSHKLKLVVLDTLSRAWAVKDENDAAEVNRAMQFFLDLAHETGTTILIIHHNRKSGGEGGKEVRGSSALVAAVDVAISLKRVEGAARNTRRIECVTREEPVDPIVIELQDGVYRNLGTAQNVRQREQEQAILDVLVEPLSLGKIIEALPYSEAVGRKILNRLSAGGQVRRSGTGQKGDPHVWSVVGKHEENF